MDVVEAEGVSTRAPIDMLRLHRFVQKLYSQKTMILCFFIVWTLLIGKTIANVNDVNDTWILEDIFPLFLLLTIVYVFAISFSSDLKLVSILTSIYLVTLNLIPQLKYDFVYGYFDPLPHYQFIQEMTRLSHVPNAGYYVAQYGTAPGSHILVSELSIVTGLNPLLAYKFFLAASPLIIPLVVYLVLKKLSMPIGLSKIILITTTITSPIMYKFIGTVAIFPMYVLFFCLLLLIASAPVVHTRSFFVIATLVGIRIIISHDATSFFLTVCLLSFLVLYFLIRLVKPLENFSGSFISLILIYIMLSFAHFIFASNFNFVTLVNSLRRMIESVFIKPPGAVNYYTGFYQLTFFEQVPVLAMRIGRDAMSILLSILAPLALLRLKLKEVHLKRFYYFLGVPATLTLASFIATQFIKSGGLVARSLFLFGVCSPFLAGITIGWFVHSSHYRFRRAVLAAVLFFLISMSLIQFYPYQPLIPKVSTSYTRTSYYVMDLRAANSIYQRSMVYFINTYNSGLSIATDPITRYLIYGVSEPSIHSLLTKEYPLERDIEARLILVFSDMNAQIIVSGRNAIEYFLGVHNAIENNSNVYTNGKSYVLLNSHGY